MHFARFQYFFRHSHRGNTRLWPATLTTTVGVLGGAGSAAYFLSVDTSRDHSHRTACESLASRASSLLPTRRFYTPEEVARRNGIDDHRIWCSFQGKVYDITDFIAQHPGGVDMIRQSSGGPLEGFWAYWAYHLQSPKPAHEISKYMIGYLQEEDGDDDAGDGRGSQSSDATQDIRQIFYESEPQRTESDMKILTQDPFTSETLPGRLQDLYTKNESFYVRNHAPVPMDLDVKTHAISIELKNDILPQRLRQEKSKKSTQASRNLQEILETYPKVAIPSILQCGGNRAGVLSAIAPTNFDKTPFQDIGVGMMGNALWSGVRLRDVLLDHFPQLAHLTRRELEQYHVEFVGADQYSTSTPLSHILREDSDCLLATEMNHEQLPRDHGYPVRVFLPGIAGCRDVKWLQSIRITLQESSSCFQKTYYLDPHGQAIQEMPMQSFMTSKEKLPSAGNNTNGWLVKGVAWGGGTGVGVQSVEVSADGGTTWHVVASDDLGRGESFDAHREWGWVQWQCEIPSVRAPNEDDDDDAGGDVPTFVCRMTDKNGVRQPEKVWYHRGYLSNVWHEL